MHASTFAALRRRMLDDQDFQKRLRAAFGRTLQEERLLAQLTTKQLDDLYIGLMLHDAFSEPQRRTASPQTERPAADVDGGTPWVQRVSYSGQPVPAPQRPPAQYPQAVSIEDWRRTRKVSP